MEIANRIETNKKKVQDYTSSIDGMRVARDMKMADIERFQSDVHEWNQKFNLMEAENIQLENQVTIQNNSMGMGL